MTTATKAISPDAPTATLSEIEQAVLAAMDRRGVGPLTDRVGSRVGLDRLAVARVMRRLGRMGLIGARRGIFTTNGSGDSRGGA